MRIGIASIVAAVAGFALATVLGVAFAETSSTGTTSTVTTTVTTTTPAAVPAPARTVTVEGVGTAPIEQGADASHANAAYRQAMAAAIGDGHDKAEYLAKQVGASLGSVQSVAEDSGSIECKTSGESETYESYDGQQPDLPRSERAVAYSAPAERSAGRAPLNPPSTKRKHKRKHPTAKAASLSCAVSAQVSLSYSLS